MKEIIKFNIGSSVFFGKNPDYVQKDNDILILFDEWNIKDNALNFKDGKGNDVFLYKNMNKDEFIKETLDSNVPMKAGKFLIPEFNEHLNISINDLETLKPLFEKMDDKHTYEKIIFNSYIENNSFTLTESQRQLAYKEYKNKRI